nr:hypothetical protein [Verrucomicrobiota bacterium]
VLQSANDTGRRPLGPKFSFKTAVGSGLGVLLRWHAYGPGHSTHANQWLLDLVDPQNGTIFHRIEGGFPCAVRMSSPDLRPLPEKNRPITLTIPGTTSLGMRRSTGSAALTPLRILRVEEPSAAGAPLRAWWEVEASVLWVSSSREDDPPLFQLPSIPPAGP